MAAFLISGSPATRCCSSAGSPTLLTEEMRHIARQRQSMSLRMAAATVDQKSLDVTVIENCLLQAPASPSTSAEVSRHFGKEAKTKALEAPMLQTASATGIGDQISSLLSPSQQEEDLICSNASPAIPASSLALRLQLQCTSNNDECIEQKPKILPQRYELCAADDIVALVAHMLAELIKTNDATFPSTGAPTRFHSIAAPRISVSDYLSRLAKYAILTPPLLLAMVYYIDRICAVYDGFAITSLTVHRFLVTAATVAAKGLSDSFCHNATYAKVGGISMAELKMLELEFLYRVDWRIIPDPELLDAYYQGLVERTPGYILDI